MGQWLIADLSVSDVHSQLWMLLVATFILLWLSMFGRRGRVSRYWLTVFIPKKW